MIVLNLDLVQRKDYIRKKIVDSENGAKLSEGAKQRLKDQGKAELKKQEDEEFIQFRKNLEDEYKFKLASLQTQKDAEIASLEANILKNGEIAKIKIELEEFKFKEAKRNIIKIY